MPRQLLMSPARQCPAKFQQIVILLRGEVRSFPSLAITLFAVLVADAAQAVDAFGRKLMKCALGGQQQLAA